MRKFFIIAVALLMCSMAFAASQLSQVKVVLNKEDGIYAKGEKVVVKACLTGECDYPLSMYVLLNGARVQEKDIELTSEPQVIYEESFNRPLCGMVYIVRKGKKNDCGVGFAFAPEELRPGYDRPEDFDRFWSRELSEMRASKPEVKLTPVDPGEKYSDRFVCYDLEISMPEGWPCRGYLALPKDAVPGSLPIVMFFHGAGVEKPSCRSSVSTAVKYAGMGSGCIAVDINAHGMLNDQPQEYYDDLARGELSDYRFRKLTTPHDFYYKYMYLRDVRALDYLCTRPEWDGKRVMVTGQSQGGAQSCAVAALDPRVKVIVAMVPGFMDVGGELCRPDNGWKRMYRSVCTTPEARSVLPYFDSVNMLRTTQARLYMEVGFMDQTCPVEGMFAGYNVAISPDKQIHPYIYRRHSMKKSDMHYKDWSKKIYRLRKEFMNDYLL